MLDRDAGGPRQAGPKIARAAGPAPGLAARLTGDSDEAEVADRGAVGRAVTIDNNHAFAKPRGGPGVGETDNAGADYREVVGLGHGDVLASGDAKRSKKRQRKRDGQKIGWRGLKQSPATLTSGVAAGSSPPFSRPD